MQVWDFIFWVSLSLIFWTYAGYYLLLKLLGFAAERTIKRAEIEPAVSLIITAHNEERRLAEKLDNTLALDYPKEKLEIIIVSDASTDRTDEIVRSYAESGVTLLVMEQRGGKHFAQGRGIAAANHDIVVCSDATTFLAPDAVRMMVRNFADPTVGCVSGEDRVKTADVDSAGEGAYVRYEMNLRHLESRAGSLVGVSGCFFSVRKELCSTWYDNMSSDFYVAILTCMRGYRVVAEREAIGSYEVLRDPGREFTRKVRTVVHGMEVLFHLAGILNPFRYGFYSLQMISHKLVRWLVPFCLIGVALSSVLLSSSHPVYIVALVGQGALYLMAVLAHLLPGLGRLSLFKIPLFFLMANMSIMVAWYRYLTGQKYVVWDSTKR
ncbi:MAG: glycosyltransferase family 2 protein [Candidatus Zixiibacteriota bacterium]